jgi:hypothetical protein
LYLNSGRTVPHVLQHPPGVSYIPTIRSYVPRVYPGSMILFRAMEQSPGCHRDPFLGWGDRVEGGVEIHDVPGLHGQIVEAPHVRVLAAKLKACLDEAQSATASAATSARSSRARNSSARSAGSTL